MDFTNESSPGFKLVTSSTHGNHSFHNRLKHLVMSRNENKILSHMIVRQVAQKKVFKASMKAGHCCLSELH